MRSNDFPHILKSIWHGMLNQVIVISYCIEYHSHTAVVTQNLIQLFALDQFDHPPYRSDLTYHLFLNLNWHFVRGMH